ncbi:cupin domain-containing protein [Rhizobiaceae sp. 2RAB30]
MAANAFEKMGASHLRVDTSRHPAMHRSHTLDYIVLLQGRVKLLLDQDERILEPFDVVIQRGTNHAWINLGDEPALLMGVLMDAAGMEE